MESIGPPPTAAPPPGALSARRPLSKRKKLLYSCLVLGGLLLVTEIVLRIVNPEIIRFVMAARRTYEYRDWYPQVLAPGVSERYVLHGDDGRTIFDFLLETDDIGVRRADPRTPLSAEWNGQRREVVACIGDSMTMGWGLDADLAYPARLQERLGPAHLVLNLGVYGFGLVASRAKLKEVEQRFAPDVVLWHFIDNDFRNDESSLRHLRRSGLRHAYERRLLAAQRRSYLLNVVPALVWVLQFRERANRPADEDRSSFGAYLSEEEWWPAARAAQTPDNATTRALLELQQECAALGRDLRVIFSQSEGASLQMGRFCLDHGIPLIVCPLGWEYRLPHDWHLNAEGCAILAAAVEQSLREKP